ncbi:hypothetical protein Tco_1030166 [Tanacetum coccineum]|uniref:Uncharacterized protein n=1 Tax=Tanacetum coccineum TaxID=301880 RepID=A0ABQ5G5G1_9ASTR
MGIVLGTSPSGWKKFIITEVFVEIERHSTEDMCKDYSRRETPLISKLWWYHNHRKVNGVKVTALSLESLNITPITQSSTFQPQKTQKPRKPNRKNTEVPQPSGSTEHEADEAV